MSPGCNLLDYNHRFRVHEELKREEIYTRLVSLKMSCDDEGEKKKKGSLWRFHCVSACLITPSAFQTTKNIFRGVFVWNMDQDI